MQPRTITLLAIILAVVIFRFLPHPPNVSPVAAMALFGGVYLADKRLAFILPFAALALSDIVIGLHDTLLYVYAAFALTVMIGFYIRSRVNLTHVTVATLASSLLFYLITNFGVWFAGGHGYTMDVSGLVQAYVAGIPFLQYSVTGNLLFVALMFGGYRLVRKLQPSLVNA
jgi:hypothetical protein